MPLKTSGIGCVILARSSLFSTKVQIGKITILMVEIVVLARAARESFTKDFRFQAAEKLKKCLACGAHGQVLSLSGAKSVPKFLT